MKIRKLSYSEFEAEKQNVLAVLLEWQKMQEEHTSKNLFKSTNSNLLYHWKESVKDMIAYLKKEISNEGAIRFKKNGFCFLIAEENDEIQGMALGVGLCTYKSQANEFFGASGLYFDISDMLISASCMLSRCYPQETEQAHKRVGKELLKAMVNHVSSMEKPCRVLARPHFNNEIAQQFFAKYLFQESGGFLGYSFHKPLLKWQN
ncbi:hypothetical protein [Legionella hackeliae]|uniref:N-acetyltransferase domain-containing protein n=1 Tax=Legionella hackeliae TaxID=449 RepID=A0A0A8USG7_LEGHA|nr:hypothetical protein [Legionella hackeliae]KTD09883.1 hypothetical protein Lhac_2251 [Legionella hackeliae]CEK11815.1 protein of unknown function [Legionella hackeliae]STX48586.1 Uncharacterised protein [Legionella hackeliae]